MTNPVQVTQEDRSADKPFKFEALSDACCKALRFAFKLRRQNKGTDIPWTGPDYEHANHFAPRHALTAESMEYADEDQGRDALTEIVAVILQLGIEQGRRIRMSDRSELLDKVHGAIFTVRVGWGDHTSIHTQSGMLANPAECLSKAIEALQAEADAVANCPRHAAPTPARTPEHDNDPITPPIYTETITDISRTYAEGIEDAAKVAERMQASILADIPAAIRALGAKDHECSHKRRIDEPNGDTICADCEATLGRWASLGTKP